MVLTHFNVKYYEKVIFAYLDVADNDVVSRRGLLVSLPRVAGNSQNLFSLPQSLYGFLSNITLSLS